MAINFPNSPSNGDIFGNYTYDDSIPGWRKTPDNAASLPAGTIVQWPGAVAPANWLICDGSAISRTEYASLFAAVGVQYGAGNGTTTFNLPNLKGRVAVGFDASQSEFDVLGELGGAKTHTLTTSEMPSHTHIQDSHNHTQNAHNHTQDAHSHTLGGTLVSSFVGFGQNSPINGNATNPSTGGVNATTATNQSTTATNQATTATNQSTGGGEAHNNLQPYIVLNYIIKTSAGITSGDSELATRVGVVENQNNLTPMSYNYVINGAFEINQRNFSSSTATGYGLDRWSYVTSGGTCTYSVQQFSPGTSFGTGFEPKQYARIVTSGQSASNHNSSLRQPVENVRTLAGQTATVSFWAKAASGTPKVAVEIAQGFGTGGSPSTTLNTYAGQVVLSTSWSRYSVTVNVPPISDKTVGTSEDSLLGLHLWVSGGSDFNSRTGSLGIQSNTFDLWGIQVEDGPYVTPFRRNSPNIQAELAACQRYYEKSYDTSTSPGTVTEVGVHRHSGSGNGSGRHYVPIRFKVEKRTNSYTVNTYNPTAAGSAWITQNSAQAGLARTPLVENKSTSGMVLNVEDGGYAWAVGNTRGHWEVIDEL
jgi:microcystin-dependent protein